MSLNEVAAELLSKLNENPEQVLLDLTARESGFKDWKDQKTQCQMMSQLKISSHPNNYRLLFAPGINQLSVEFYDVFDPTVGESFTVRLFIEKDGSVKM